MGEGQVKVCPGGLSGAFFMDEIGYMKQALELAKRGAGYVSPNPMVGAVLVKNDRIIGVGYHKRFGGNHAEINAIRDAESSLGNSSDIRGSTLYINLEPCSIFGKTPPCTEAITKAGISRVVVAMKDPNPKINGKGLSILRNHGIEVQTEVCEREALELNRFFITFMKYRRPYVALKMALSLDGWLAEASGKSKWISNTKSRHWVHQRRAEYDAVLVGVETIVKDNPFLTTHGRGRDPWRIILDPDMRAPKTSRVLSSNRDQKTWLICKQNFQNHGKVKISPILSPQPETNIGILLNHLAGEGIASIWVEGGAKTFSYFLKTGIMDEINIFYAPKFLGRGLNPIEGIYSIGRKWPLRLVQTESFGNDVLHRYRWIA